MFRITGVQLLRMETAAFSDTSLCTLLSVLFQSSALIQHSGAARGGMLAITHLNNLSSVLCNSTSVFLHTVILPFLHTLIVNISGHTHTHTHTRLRGVTGLSGIHLHTGKVIFVFFCLIAFPPVDHHYKRHVS